MTDDESASYGAAWIFRIGICLEDDAEATGALTAPSLYSVIDEWWDRVAEWIAVVEKQLHLTDLGQARHAHLVGGGLFLWTPSAKPETSVDFVYNPNPIAATGRSTGALTRSRWQAILRKVEGGASPPLMWRLLRSAQHLIAAGSTRRALLDAGTSAELALTELLDHKLAQTPPEVSAALLDSNPALSRKARLLLRLGGTLPPRFQQDLVEPRNRATHEGSSPTQKEAEIAIRAAETVVSEAHPRESLLN